MKSRYLDRRRAGAMLRNRKELPMFFKIYTLICSVITLAIAVYDYFFGLGQKHFPGMSISTSTMYFVYFLICLAWLIIAWTRGE